MKIQTDKCKSCYTCEDFCSVDHEIFLDQSSPECIRCLDCTTCAHDAVNSKEQPAAETAPASESDSIPPQPPTNRSYIVK
ncbi:MAG: hypothetical protein QME64_02120 [bacterium]|nr:hypothetical protein [bacterium]